MNLRLVMNPGSRAGRGRRLWRRWEALLRERGCSVESCLTQSLSHARDLARVGHRADAVVAVGGDGTINAVLDGIMQSGRQDLAMGVLYSGTSPDFCRFHGIPVDPCAAVTALLDGRRRRVDIARIMFIGAEGKPETSHFGCGANIGLGAAVARRANRWRRYLGDGAGTGLAAVWALLGMPTVNLELEIDGTAVRVPRCNNLSILKSPFMASGLKLDVGLRPDDGALCMVSVAGKNPVGLLRTLPGFYTGRAARDPSVRVWRGRRAVVRGLAPAEVEFDGDPRGFLPVTVDLVQGGLLLLGGT